MKSPDAEMRWIASGMCFRQKGGKVGMGARSLTALAGMLWMLTPMPAAADPWIPAADHGKSKLVLRFYSSERKFSSHFSTDRVPSSSKYSETQGKLTGLHGLGAGWAFQYDLRAASLRKTKKKSTYSAAGLQDLEIGLAKGLRQRPGFADAVAFNVVLPTGSTDSNPQLGVGHWAVEPDYQFGVAGRPGGHYAFGSFAAGLRFFPNGGVTQLRASADTGIGLVPRLGMMGTLFLSKSFGGNASVTSSNPYASEVYNLLRGGLWLQYALSKKLRPILGYEADLAGQDIHAGGRFVLGVAWRY